MNPLFSVQLESSPNECHQSCHAAHGLPCRVERDRVAEHSTHHFNSTVFNQKALQSPRHNQVSGRRPVHIMAVVER